MNMIRSFFIFFITLIFIVLLLSFYSFHFLLAPEVQSSVISKLPLMVLSRLDQSPIINGLSYLQFKENEFLYTRAVDVFNEVGKTGDGLSSLAKKTRIQKGRLAHLPEEIRAASFYCLVHLKEKCVTNPNNFQHVANMARRYLVDEIQHGSPSALYNLSLLTTLPQTGFQSNAWCLDQLKNNPYSSNSSLPNHSSSQSIQQEIRSAYSYKAFLFLVKEVPDLFSAAYTSHIRSVNENVFEFPKRISKK